MVFMPKSIFICIMIAFVLLTLTILVGLMSVSLSEKSVSFECGFNPLTSKNSYFSVKFFLILILFLVFDLEVSMLLPITISGTMAKGSFLLPGIFLMFLVLGMTVEWFNGIIEWSS